MIGEVKGGRMTMLHQVENISKYIEIIKENLNSRVEKFNDWNKNLPKGLNSIFKLAKEIISRLEVKLIEILHQKIEKKKLRKMNRGSKKNRGPTYV